MTKSLDDLLDSMPDENAPEEEINAFVEQVLATPGGEELIRDFAGKITEGGTLDTMLKEAEAELANLKLKSPARLIFRIELPQTKPLVWRRFSLPADCAYFHLHCAIQDSFGWQNSHLHRFEVWEDGRRELTFSLGREDEPLGDDYCEIENGILDLFRENVLEFIYLYDFEDNWRHRVIIEDFVQAGIKGTSKKRNAHLHGGEGHGPPEGCGGVRGFAEFLEGGHPMCEQFEASVLEKFKTEQPDFSKIVLRDPSEVLRRK
ncbi:MAG: plasmid pRiA4b ORF-3 family protein [Akkermansiaceae bacterium]|nr:plasmid pRiA4b ORF-3 family protein [Akkermansiaceae bacterium]